MNTLLGSFKIPDNKNGSRVIFSEEAFRDILLETKERITTETGGVFLGKIIGKDWLVLEAIDPGPKSRFSEYYFEYDSEYVEHLANKIARKYDSLELLGLWHRHPENFNVFTDTDFNTFKKYIFNVNRGIISGLVNLVPEFKFTLFYIDKDMKCYRDIKYQVKDSEKLRREYGIKLKEVDELQKEIRIQSNRTGHVSQRSILQRNGNINSPREITQSDEYETFGNIQISENQESIASSLSKDINSNNGIFSQKLSGKILLIIFFMVMFIYALMIFGMRGLHH